LERLPADDDVWEIMVNGPDAILSESVSTVRRSSCSGLM
jgi:hypothetical protein